MRAHHVCICSNPSEHLADTRGVLSHWILNIMWLGNVIDIEWMDLESTILTSTEPSPTRNEYLAISSLALTTMIALNEALLAAGFMVHVDAMMICRLFSRKLGIEGRARYGAIRAVEMIQ